MSKVEQLHQEMKKLIGEKESNEFFDKLLNIIKTDPKGAISKIKMAKAFL